jgi:hypothetical protein
MGMALLVIGILLSVVGGIWLLITAFQESVGWGLACMFLPIVSLIFVFLHWEESKRPFLIGLAGNILVIAGAALKGPD